jgi:hypothetical protein
MTITKTLTLAWAATMSTSRTSNHDAGQIESGSSGVNTKRSIFLRFGVQQ